MGGRMGAHIDTCMRGWNMHAPSVHGKAMHGCKHGGGYSCMAGGMLRSMCARLHAWLHARLHACVYVRACARASRRVTRCTHSNGDV
eukprot:302910-Chlamydomonas_euryale.AAC.2